MESMQPKPSVATQYMKTLMELGMKGISYVITTPESLRETGQTGMELLKGFRYDHEREMVVGEISAAAARDAVKKAVDIGKSFFRAALLVTCTVILLSRFVSILPIVPTFLILLAIPFGIITSDTYCTTRQGVHTYTHFNGIHLQAINYQIPEERERIAKLGPPTVTFDQFVGIIDSYSRQILADTWIISGFDPVEKSLTNWRPLLTELVKNQTEGTEVPPLVTATKFFPFLPLICQVAEAADQRF
ncbi:MAG: hypothetical protein H7A41_08180 [Chlamydiales bacterium]|nr:hypothetical protein [Chlamydiales bacterium]